MKRLPPLRTYSPLSRRAVVRIAAESEPEPGSVSAYAASHSPDASLGRKRCFCSSLPASLSPSDPSSCTAMMRPLVAQTFDTSSIATSAISAEAPTPPYSSSNRIPKISFSRKSSTTSHGNSALLSISAARGAIRSRARSRTRSRISRCSSVSGSTDIARSLVPVVVYGLDVVAVGVEHERAVIADVVDRPFSGRAVVFVAGRDGDAVERVHGRVVGHAEREVQMLRPRAPVLHERERASGADDVEALRPRVRDAHADHGRNRLVEPLRRRHVGDPDPHVVDDVLAGPRLLGVDRLGAVAVRGEQKAAVIALRVLRPR